MKKFLLLSIALITISILSFSQGAFKVRSKVFLKGNAKFPIMHSGVKVQTEELTSSVYDPNGKKTASINTVKKDWAADTVFNFDEKKYEVLKGKKYLYADLVQNTDKSKVYIYFWPFKDKIIAEQKGGSTEIALSSGNQSFNNLITSSTFSINLPARKYLKFKTFAQHSGPITLPFRVYLSSRDDNHVSNVTTDVNAGVYYGWKWGKKGFVNQPAEKEGKSHENFTSINLIGGFTKIDVDGKNSINGSVAEGSVLSFSPGLGLGYHYDSFGMFLALGMDFAIGNSIAKEWRFKNQPWIGFGFGFSIFK